MSLLPQVLKGVIWTSIGRFYILAFEFFIGIVLARLLDPSDFGLLGMLTIVITISDLLVNSGLSQSLVRQKDVTNDDYSTIFYFNLGVGVIVFFTVFSTAAWVSAFFKEPQLESLLKILALGIIINSLSFIQRTINLRNLNFQLQSKGAILSVTVSGIISLCMAATGWGVWSLVAKILFRDSISAIYFWVTNKWTPAKVFIKSSFIKNFKFGSNLLVSGLIGTFFNNLYLVLIGRIFSAVTLGFYNRAELFKNLASQNIESIITTVVFPVLSKIQHDKVQFLAVFQRLLRVACMIVFFMMFQLMSNSSDFIYLLIGEKWLPAAGFLTLLCGIGIMHPLNSITINTINVLGRSDIYLKTQFVFQLLTFPALFVGYFWGISYMIVAMIANTVIMYIIYTNSLAKLLGFSIKDAFLNILPIFLLTSVVLWANVIVGWGLTDPVVRIFTKITVSTLAFITLSEVLKNRDYLYLKNIAIAKFNQIRSK